jgi:predicted cupin superfamily sugar epimerase
MGTDVAAGEVRQLLVGTGVWKKSSLLPADLESAKTQDQKDCLGCLITEVVTPGFHWEDHQFLTMGGLQELLKGVVGEAKIVEELAPFITKSA